MGEVLGGEGVVLGYCEDCGRPVRHDQDEGEFCYDAGCPARLVAVYCPSCAAARFGVLPVGCVSAAEAEAFLDDVTDVTRGAPVRVAARERISEKMRTGERVTGRDLSELIGCDGLFMKDALATTDGAERLRRHRETGGRVVGSPLGPPLGEPLMGVAQRPTGHLVGLAGGKPGGGDCLGDSDGSCRGHLRLVADARPEPRPA